MLNRQLQSFHSIEKGARPILDAEVFEFLRKINGVDLFEGSSVSPISEQITDFKAEFCTWMNEFAPAFFQQSHSWNSWVVAGVSEAIEAFNTCHQDKPYFVLRGEYPFHKMMGAQVAESIEQVPKGSRLFISHPFSATGNAHFHLKHILQQADQKEITVFVDCAYLLNSNLKLGDVFSHSCIDAVAFSLSKFFCTGRTRAGLLFTRSLWKNSAVVALNQWSYVNQLSLKIHRLLMAQFPADFIWNKYRRFQLEICQQLEIEPSNTVLFGLSHDPSYQQFSRSGIVNRLCLANSLEGLAK
jgi:hypothetical protein